MNNEQLKAVNTVNGPVMTIAGPGSGKTTVIVNRVLHMTRDLKIEPTSILVVTFTKAAALEMRKRYLALSGSSEKVNFGTFHSIFFHILKQHYNYTNQNILSDSQSFQIVRALLDKRTEKLSGNNEFVLGILDEIGQAKAKAYAELSFTSRLLPTKEFNDILRGYNNYLEELNLIDFEDMLTKTLDLLKGNEKERAYWQKKFAYILVDEFQDINAIQYEITRILAAPGNNLFVVGDDDQSIYAFRGASPAIMKHFPVDYPDTATIQLRINYRSTHDILKKAVSVIRNNRERYDKDLIAEKDGENSVVIRRFDDSNAEYRAIATAISEEIKGGRAPGQIAILFRTNRQADYICSKLLDLNLPFNLRGDLPTLFDNRFVTPLLAYLRFLNGEETVENFLKFMNKPVRYIERAAVSAATTSGRGFVTTKKAGGYTQNSNHLDFDKLLAYYNSGTKPYVTANVRELRHDMTKLRALAPDAAISYIRKHMGYDAYVRETLSFSKEACDEAMDLLADFEAYATEFKKFGDFLQYCEEYKLKMKQSSSIRKVSAINLMTYHGAKGLEFASVYLPDCEEGMTPHRKSVKPEDIEEERRMFYVAMTRAKDHLWISSSKKRLGHDDLPLSRFVNELRMPEALPKVGTRICHGVYKEGTVVKVKGDNLFVKFDNLALPKKLNYKYCVSHGLLSGW